MSERTSYATFENLQEQADMSHGFATESIDAKKSTPTTNKSTQVADIGCIQHTLVEQFAEIEDPRVERTKKYQLTDILGDFLKRKYQASQIFLVLLKIKEQAVGKLIFLGN